MNLVELETEDGTPLFVNPEFVAFILPGKDEDHSEIHLSTGEVLDVGGGIDDIMETLLFD